MSADPNAADQDAAWNGPMGARWLEHHEALDRMLNPLGEIVLSRVEEMAGAGGSLLDLGCGTGATTGRLATRCPESDVIGIDISRQLVAEAERSVGAAEPRVRFAVADAGRDPLGGPFQAIASRFGTMFFPEPGAAFAHLGGELAPGGALAMLVWQEPSANPWVTVPLGAAADRIELPAPPPGGPGPFSLADPEATIELLATAGFADATAEPFVRPLPVGDDPRSAADYLLSVLPTGPLIDGLADDARRDLVDAVAGAVAANADRRDDAQLTLDGAAWLVTARRPSN